MANPKAYPNKICPLCEKEFTPWKSYQQYCTHCLKYRANDIKRLVRARKKQNIDAKKERQTRTCPICKGEFVPVNGTHTYCKDCRANRKDDIAQYLADLTAKKKKKKPVVKSVMEICKDLEEYNRKHGTLLSYGKYIEKLENGTLKIC